MNRQLVDEDVVHASKFFVQCWLFIILWLVTWTSLARLWNNLKICMLLLLYNLLALAKCNSLACLAALDVPCHISYVPMIVTENFLKTFDFSCFFLTWCSYNEKDYSFCCWTIWEDYLEFQAWSVNMVEFQNLYTAILAMKV